MNLIDLIAAFPEESAWHLARMLDADSYLVTFGGVSGFTGDDVSKFPWLSQAIHHPFPNITTEMFLNDETPYLVAPRTPRAVQISTIFSFGDVCVFANVAKGTDLARGVEVGDLDFRLSHFAEAYTSAHWMVHIYRVIPNPISDCA
jgi:hypothetical protein